MATFNVPVLAYSKDDAYIDLKDGDPQLLCTLPSGDGQFHPINIVVHNTDVDGLISAAVLSIGTNSPNYNNIASGIVAATMNDQQTVVSLAGTTMAVDEEAEVYVNVTVPSVATEHLARVYVVGHH